MKIAFDAHPLLSGTKSGVGFCEDGLIRQMMRQHPEDEYSLEYFSLRNREEKEKALAKYQGKHRKLCACRWFPGSLYRMASTFFPIPYGWLFSEKKDVTHFFNYYIPPLAKGKRVVTIHDMAFRIYPETVRKKTLWFLRRTLKKSIRRADHIITISEFSKRELLRFYKIPENIISIVPCGVNFARFHPLEHREQLETIKEKYGTGEEYFLYLGNLEPRKNLVRLIHAYAEAKDGKTEFPHLVLAGGKGWMYENIFQTVGELGLEQDIVFTGYMEDDEVPVLMGGAMAFCFPSLYEGFGMPVLEAMACGVPVLTSAHSAMEEVAGDAAVFVDPEDVSDISDKIRSLYDSRELRLRCRQRGLEQAKKYTWENAVNKLYAVYENVVGRKEEKEKRQF